MSAIKLEKFGGMLPAWSETNLPENQSAGATNAYLFSGDLTGWRQPKLLRQLNNSAAQAVFRIPKITKAAATAVLTFSTNVTEGDTVTVGEETYKFTATVTKSYDVLIGGTKEASAANFLAALTVSLGEGLTYGLGTIINPSISIITADNILSGAILTLKAPDFGAQYNTTAVTESTSGARVSWANPTFTGGSNPFADNTITGPSTWLEFLDQNTDVMKSPVVGDQFDRFYAASPSLPPQYNTHARIDSGDPWWLLGVPPPGCPPGINVAGGGATAVLGFPNLILGGLLYGLKANTAYMIPITPKGAMSLNDVSFLVTASDPALHYAALLYADYNGIPGTLLATGEVMTGVLDGSTSEVPMVAPFSNPSGLAADTQYWIGIVADGDLRLVTGDPANGPVGYQFKTPFTAIPGSAPPINTPVKVTSVTLIDKSRSLYQIGIDTPLAQIVNKYDILDFILSRMAGAQGGGFVAGTTGTGGSIGRGAPSFIVDTTASAGASSILIQIASGSIVPQVGWSVVDRTSPDAVKGGWVGGSFPPLNNQPNLQMWADLTTQSILEARAYLYTYVTEYDEEGPPSPPTLVNGWSNATWNISLFTPPLDDMGVLRNIKTVRLYRTISGSQGNTVYYWVADVPVGTAQYIDTVDDSVIALNIQMPSTNWFPPPEGLQGFKSMPNGMVVGFKANELWFCEPYRPHAWPVGYVLTTEFPIIGIGVSGQSIVACTSAYPYIATGPSPGAMTLTKIMFPEPCVARCSVVSASDGVYYQSPNGLIKVAQSGAASNTTELWITREKWKKLVPATSSIQAIIQSSCYFAFGTVSDSTPGIARMGYTIELNPADAQSFTIWPQPGGHRIGFCQLTAPNGYDIVNLLIDQWTGIGLIIQNGQVWYYDFTDTAPAITPFIWRSKTFQQQTKNNFAAMKVFFDIPPGTPAQSLVRNETDTNDPSWSSLAANQYGIIRVYADNVLVTTREIRRSGELLRISAGFKADQWKFEFEGRISISNVQIATSSKELSQV